MQLFVGLTINVKDEIDPTTYGIGSDKYSLYT